MNLIYIAGQCQTWFNKCHMPSPTVILVRPQSLGNLGAVARSMANFGLDSLRVVGSIPQGNTDHVSGSEISAADWALATPRGHQILKNVSLYESLESAIEDCHYVLGSSGKKDLYHGGYQREMVSSDHAFDALFFEKASNKEFNTCMVFGPEDDGLSAQEASHCDRLIHIPTQSQAPSMNLAMAATILFYSYRISQNAPLNHAPAPSITPSIAKEDRSLNATSGEIENLIQYVFNALEPTQFFKHPDTESTKARLRRILRDLKLNVGDLLFVFEIFYQLKCWGQKSYEGRDFLKNHSTPSKIK